MEHDASKSEDKITDLVRKHLEELKLETAGVPEPIFATRDPPIRSSRALGPKKKKSNQHREPDLIEISPIGLDNLANVCYYDGGEFQGPGEPWPWIPLPGQPMSVNRELVQRRFCSSACTAAWLDSCRDTTQKDRIREKEYAEYHFGFRTCPGTALPRILLFLRDAQGCPVLSLDDFRAYGDYFLHGEQQHKSKVQKEWLTTPSVEGVLRLERLRMEQVQIFASCLKRATGPPASVCYHDEIDLDLDLDTRLVWPMDSSAAPSFFFCDYPCLLFWVLHDRSVNRMQALTKIRELHFRQHKTLELPGPAPDKTCSQRYQVPGSQRVVVAANKPATFWVMQEPFISHAGMRVQLGSSEDEDEDDAAKNASLLSPTQLVRDVMATYKTQGEKHVVLAQNMPGMKCVGPEQTYRAYGMTLKTHRRMHEQPTVSDQLTNNINSDSEGDTNEEEQIVQQVKDLLQE
jgi:hypothetical protein